VLVAIPTLLVLTCGILILIFQQSVFDVVIGLLLVLFCIALGAGAAITLLGIHADRRLAELQIEFVSKVSHEFKTPLTSIRMFVETLKLGRVQEQARIEYCLDVISKETDRLSTLISRLLSWGAMEAGAFHIELEKKPAKELIDLALRAFEPQVIASGAKLEVKLEDELPIIDVDSTVMVDAILNLLNNALRYGGEDKQIRLEAQRREDGRVAISVQDRGVGIEQKHQRRIFERFYRVDDSYHGKGGTGLGLAIARHVVLAHGGQIELKSEPGAGSTFTILLPAVTVQPEVAA
jgi:two-component system phosphate regulon sensor histidine kinase PhoR